MRLALPLALAAATLACGGQKPSATEAPAAPPAATAPAQPAAPAVEPGRPVEPPATVPAPATATPPAPEPAKPTPPAPSAPPAPKPAPTPAPAPATPPAPATTPAPAPAPPAVTPPAAPPAQPAHARVGPDKCKGCHRIQYDSWAASAHKAKDLDCEGCHGNGADYRSSSVMKNRAAAVAAGLVLPGPEACKRCHAKADAALLPKVHLHKAK